ncbi:RidA family protein [Citreicella sp. C3M06]|uniref:RidA family protein n=1 Tax=Citreicella sp. C3M06 TaxID=2841564 RepID=UPI001C081C89|nr:RidA family protein [Citreicella sp. C3M06]MBU2962584.1 RidA family protein [Citreicella sp. C3M06]
MDITRIRGPYTGRNSGTSYNGMGWAVATTQIDTDDVFEQTASTLARLDEILGQMGTDKTRLLSATIYLTDIAQKDAMDRAWTTWIGDDPAHWPQRACVQSGLAAGHLVEIVVLAAV